MLVGNKVDLVENDEKLRQVTQEEAQQLCQQYRNMQFVETSAMTGTNVHLAFGKVLQAINSSVLEEEKPE